MTFLILLNSLIFILLALLHIYWAAGGKWARNIAIPVNRKGRKAFHPSRGSTLMVATGLFLFALITFGNSGAFNEAVDLKVFQYGNWAIGIIFLLRAIGDFKYFGFAKRIRHTDFAFYDTKLFSPLALAIATSSFVIAYWS
jgi:hypothetical protein